MFRAMSTLGEVVFCVDCDGVRQAQMNGTDVLSADAELPPRRMAVKRDANGDPLCAACLDARHVSRRAEFLLHEGRAPIPGFQPMSQLSIETGAEPNGARQGKPKSRLIRIVRQRGAEAQSEPPPPPAEPPAERPRAAGRRGKRDVTDVQVQLPLPAPRPAKRDRGAEKQFVMLAAEMGFLRAQELLDELQSRITKVTRGGAR
jgi:hypothetical protein